MTIDRRTLFAMAAAATAAGPVAAQPSTSPAPKPPLAERIGRRAAENRLRLDHRDGRFSGPAWDLLVREGAAAQFFLVGEEHGIAENPKLAAALFTALVPAGYSRVGLEISPVMAPDLDRALADGGLGGLKRLFADQGSMVAFYTMQEEAEFLAAARAALPGRAPMLWGMDYDIGADRRLIARLKAKRKPAAATAALDKLEAASTASWAKYAETRNPQFIYSFGGDPADVAAVRAAWPKADAEAAWILQVLEETLIINRLFMSGQGWASNERRSRFIRDNFLRHWRAERAAGRTPKTLFKFGGSHLTRGRNQTETFDLGTALPEIAALEGGTTFSMLVLPGAATQVAVFNPVKFAYESGPAKDGYANGLDPLLAQAYPDAFTLIDLRPLRPLLPGFVKDAHPELMRVVHGYDALLVMSGSTPSRNL